MAPSSEGVFHGTESAAEQQERSKIAAEEKSGGKHQQVYDSSWSDTLTRWAMGVHPLLRHLDASDEVQLIR